MMVFVFGLGEDTMIGPVAVSGPVGPSQQPFVCWPLQFNPTCLHLCLTNPRTAGNVPRVLLGILSSAPQEKRHKVSHEILSISALVRITCLATMRPPCSSTLRI